MGLNISRTVKIHISNNTQNITLKNPKTYFYSGHSLKAPKDSLPPGFSSKYKFINSSSFWGCNGVLAFEAESFTMAIYFSNPIDYNRFSVETGLELSLDNVHRMDLEESYKRLVRNSQNSDQNFKFPSVILKEPQEEGQLSSGPVKVTATVSRGRNTVITVEVKDQSNSDYEDRRESLCRARHVQEK